MVRHTLKNALVIWRSGQCFNSECNSGEASPADELNRQAENASEI
jgi:hypothetical protein